MKESKRIRNDWVVVFLFLFFGIVLMLFAGQKGTQLLPNWNLHVDIGSNLDLNNFPVALNSQGLPPLRSDILTPPIWRNNFLTPQSGASATPPTFVVFEPSATPSTTITATITTTATPVTATTTPSATKTKTPDDDPSTPPTPTPTSPTPTPPTPEPPVTSTVDPILEISPTPITVNVGPPDDEVYDIPEGNYIVIDVSGSPIEVEATPDGNYDMVFYEDNFDSTTVQMDQVIIGISENPDGNPYYEVFNWGDGDPDTNTNLGDVTTATGTEYDNQDIDMSEFQGAGDTQTGVLIDVDNAESNPPPGDYYYVVVISPPVANQDPPLPAEDTSAQIDSVEVTEVDIPP